MKTSETAIPSAQVPEPLLQSPLSLFKTTLASLKNFIKPPSHVPPSLPSSLQWQPPQPPHHHHHPFSTLPSTSTNSATRSSLFSNRNSSSGMMIPSSSSHHSLRLLFIPLPLSPPHAIALLPGKCAFSLSMAGAVLLMASWPVRPWPALNPHYGPALVTHQHAFLIFSMCLLGREQVACSHACCLLALLMDAPSSQLRRRCNS